MPKSLPLSLESGKLMSDLAALKALHVGLLCLGKSSGRSQDFWMNGEFSVYGNRGGFLG